MNSLGSRLMSHTRLVPALVLLMGIAAIVAITSLQERSVDARQAQLTLSGVAVQLGKLQNAPFLALKSTGGSPSHARSLIDSARRQIDGPLARLGNQSPPPALARAQAPLRRNYATLEQIYSLAVATNNYGPAADRLSGVAAASEGEVAGELAVARAVYERRALRAQLQATVGSATVILLLGVAFALLYRGVSMGRHRAEALAEENARLHAAAQHEALTDALTGLGNRRALNEDLAATLAPGDQMRPHVMALYDLNGFKQYNDTFGHPAGDALLIRLGESFSASVGARGRAYRMGGDEFCVLGPMDGGDAEQLVTLAADALSATGEGFEIDCCSGSVALPAEASQPKRALRIADQRLYRQKNEYALTV
jgi:diguanylate cyclase (GGDEF)-like protein